MLVWGRKLKLFFYIKLFALVMVRYLGEEKLAIQFNTVIIVAKIGSIQVSAKLPTYPSPELTLTLTFHLGQNDGLGEG